MNARGQQQEQERRRLLDQLGIEPLRVTMAELMEGKVDLVARLQARWGLVDTALGQAVVTWTDAGVCSLRLRVPELSALDVVDQRRPLRPEPQEAPEWLQIALERLDGSGVPVDLTGVGGFQREVIQVAATIPRGQTRPYGWVAREIGNPRAVRAVGTALGRNPVPLVVPCHRVVKSDGTPGHYVFGDEAKRELLRREAELV